MKFAVSLLRLAVETRDSHYGDHMAEFSSDSLSITQTTLLSDKVQSASSRFVEQAWKSAAYSALQMPYEGLTQIVDKIANQFNCDDICPKLHLVKPPEQVAFGTAEWHGQQVGGAFGLVVPLLALQLGVNKTFKATGLSERILGTCNTPGAAGAVMLQTLHPERKMMLLAAEAATTGFVFDSTLRPVKEGDPFVFTRLANGAAGALTWTTLSAATSGLKAWSISRNAVERPWLINTFRSDLLRHAIAGGAAGIVDAQAHSLLNLKGFASFEDTVKSAYGFAMVGTVMHGTAETANRAAGKHRLADIVNNDPDLKAAVKLDPVAKELLANAGETRVKTMESPDVYKLLEFDFASKKYEDTRIGAKVARKPWKSFQDTIRQDADLALNLSDAIAKFASDNYGAQKCKLIACGKDSCVLLLESNEVLKVSWGKHQADHGQRPFDAEAKDVHQGTVSGYDLVGLKQPLLVSEVPRRLNQIFRDHAARMNYNFTDWLAPQLGYGNKRLNLIDYFAVTSDMSTFGKYQPHELTKLADISKIEANGNYMTPKRMR